MENSIEHNYIPNKLDVVRSTKGCSWAYGVITKVDLPWCWITTSQGKESLIHYDEIEPVLTRKDEIMKKKDE